MCGGWQAAPETLLVGHLQRGAAGPAVLLVRAAMRGGGVREHGPREEGHLRLQGMVVCGDGWVQHVYHVIAQGVGPQQGGRVQRLNTLQLRELVLWEVLKLSVVHMAVVVVPVLWLDISI